MTDHRHSGSPSEFHSKVKTDSSRFERNQKAVAELVTQMRNEEEIIRTGGGDKAIEAPRGKPELFAVPTSRKLQAGE